MRKYFIFAILFILSCGSSEKEKIISNHSIEYTKKSNKYVYGKFKLNNEIVKVKKDGNWVIAPEMLVETEKEINFDDLQRTLFFQCQSELEMSTPDIAGISCYNTELQLEHRCVESGVGDTHENSLCTQSIYTCIGYKNLELAELTGEKSISGYAVNYNYTDIVANDTPETVLFFTESTFKNKIECTAAQNKYAGSPIFYSTEDDSYGACGTAQLNPAYQTDMTPCNFSMTIGPQKPEIKTWLYRAALDAFERAGISASRVLRDPTGFDFVMSTATQKEYGITIVPTLREKFAVEFSERIPTRGDIFIL